MKRNGFTLIELVVVIVVLGILSAIAAPKFLSIQSDSRVAALDAFVGAFKAADGIVVGKAAIAGLENSQEETIIPDSEVTILQNHMTLKIENVMKAMDTSGYNLTQFEYDPKNRLLFVVYLGDEQSDTELVSNRCMIIISRYSDLWEEGPKFKALQIRKLYDGC